LKNSELNAAHENSILQLVEEFGKNHSRIICTTYNEQRKKLEKEASVLLFVPILACNATRELLQRNNRS
jgi:hypothetical protein